MPLEIERKFLVVGDSWKSGHGSLIRQGYLSCNPAGIVRVRVSEDSAWITVKSTTTGTTRKEFEYPIPVADAAEMLAICKCPVIEKTRRYIQHAGRSWEIDEFHGENAGLVVAEIELKSEGDVVDLPPWVGAEVTNDSRYYNSNLAVHPYTRWE